MLKEQSPIEKFEKFINGGIYSLTYAYPNVTFNESGALRFASVIGYIVGLHKSGNTKLASTLACELDKEFTRFSEYGGIEEVELRGETKKFPRYKFIIGDDGTFNGFTIGWHIVTDEKSDKTVDSLTETRYEGVYNEKKEYLWSDSVVRYYRPTMFGAMIFRETEWSIHT